MDENGDDQQVRLAALNKWFEHVVRKVSNINDDEYKFTANSLILCDKE